MLVINEVNLRRAWLVLGWVTVSGLDSRGRQFYPPCDGKMSISQRVVILCGWEVKPGMACLYGNCVLPYLSALENALGI